jgi:hypothetical protein
MADLFVTLFVVGFFALCFVYVRACDRIVGSDRDVLPAGEQDEPAGSEAAR